MQRNHWGTAPNFPGSGGLTEFSLKLACGVLYVSDERLQYAQVTGFLILEHYTVQWRGIHTHNNIAAYGHQAQNNFNENTNTPETTTPAIPPPPPPPPPPPLLLLIGCLLQTCLVIWLQTLRVYEQRLATATEWSGPLYTGVAVVTVSCSTTVLVRSVVAVNAHVTFARFIRVIGYSTVVSSRYTYIEGWFSAIICELQ